MNIDILCATIACSGPVAFRLILNLPTPNQNQTDVLVFDRVLEARL